MIFRRSLTVLLVIAALLPQVSLAKRMEYIDKLIPPTGSYTIAWLSDTQYYSRSFPETFITMTRFLRDNAKKLKIGYVIHTGDVVHNVNNKSQWENAAAALENISKLPRGILAGNHDMKSKSRDISSFVKYVKPKTYFDNCHGVGCCGYSTIKLGKTDYIFVFMGYNPTNSCVRYAKKAFDRNKDKVGILAVHDYIDTDMTLRKHGEMLQRDVVAKCKNVYMVLCGHRYNSGIITTRFDDDGDGKKDDRTVYQIIANYQAVDKMGGSGYMRFLQVDEKKDEIRVYTYSPLLNDYNFYDAEPIKDEFVLPITW